MAGEEVGRLAMLTIKEIQLLLNAIYHLCEHGNEYEAVRKKLIVVLRKRKIAVKL